MLTPHSTYLTLGHDPQARATAYAAWLHSGVNEEERRAIQRHLAQERVWGDARFQEMVEKTLNRPVVCRPRGRPRIVCVENDEN